MMVLINPYQNKWVLNSVTTLAAPRHGVSLAGSYVNLGQIKPKQGKGGVFGAEHLHR
jgi:hypothetical protein